jgi:hypothetical protein
MIDPKASIRAALDALVQQHEGRVREVLDDADARIAASVRKLAPLFEALQIVADEVAGKAGITVSLAKHKHVGNIQAGTIHLRIDAGLDATAFCIEETVYEPWADGDTRVMRHRIDEMDEALHIIMDRIASHIATQATLEERRRS